MVYNYMFPDSSVGKESACNAGDPGLIPGLGRSAGERIAYPFQYPWASLVAQLVKNPPAMQCNAGDLGSIPGLGRCPGEGKGYPLQYSGLESSMDCKVHGVAKSRTRQSDFHFHFSGTVSVPKAPHECVTRLKTSLQSFNVLEFSINLWVWYLETVCSR